MVTITIQEKTITYINIAFTYYSKTIAGFTNITLMQWFKARGDCVPPSQGA